MKTRTIFLALFILLAFTAAGAQDWTKDIEGALARHPEIRQAVTAVSAAQEDLKNFQLSRWSLPVGVSAEATGADGLDADLSAGVSAGVSFPLGETAALKAQRVGLEQALSAAVLTLEEVQKAVTGEGISAYWKGATDELALKGAIDTQALKTSALERIKTLWDLGQASLTDWTSANQELSEAEAALTQARKSALLSRRAWYAFLGREDGGEVWASVPQLKKDLPDPWAVEFQTTSDWVKGRGQLELARLTSEAAREADLPLSLQVSALSGSGQSLSFQLSTADAQGRLNWEAPIWSSSVSASASPSWSVGLSLNPDLLSYTHPDRSAELALEKTQAQWEALQQSLSSQAATQKADWEAALSSLRSAQSALERIQALNDSVKIKLAAGRALALDGETSRLELEKARLNLVQAQAQVFSAATAAGESPWNLIEKEVTHENSL